MDRVLTGSGSGGERLAGERTLVGDHGDGEADCGVEVDVAERGGGSGRGGGRSGVEGGGGSHGGGGESGPGGGRRPAPAGDGPRVRVLTPPDPATGRTVLEMDALEFVHRVTTQIPDHRRHLVRYYGAYSSRTRGALRARREAEAAASAAEPSAGSGSAAGEGSASAVPPAPSAPPATEPAPPPQRSRASWARLVPASDLRGGPAALPALRTGARPGRRAHPQGGGRDPAAPLCARPADERARAGSADGPTGSIGLGAPLP